jgi:hypothetical protein
VVEGEEEVEEEKDNLQEAPENASAQIVELRFLIREGFRAWILNVQNVDQTCFPEIKE